MDQRVSTPPERTIAGAPRLVTAASANSPLVREKRKSTQPAAALISVAETPRVVERKDKHQHNNNNNKSNRDDNDDDNNSDDDDSSSSSSSSDSESESKGTNTAQSDTEEGDGGRDDATDDETEDDDDELEPLASLEEARMELAAIQEVHRNHNRHVLAQVKKFKGFMDEGASPEVVERVMGYMERLEEIEERLWNEDMLAYSQLQRRLLKLNQARRREALTKYNSAVLALTPRSSSASAERVSSTSPPSGTLRVVGGWEERQLEQLKRRQEIERLNADMSLVSPLFSGELFTFSILEGDKDSIEEVQFDYKRFDTPFTDVDAITRDFWTFLQVKHKDVTDRVDWPKFAGVFFRQIAKGTPQYKAVRLLLGEVVTKEHFNHFLRWFGPRQEGKELIEHMMEIIKIPGFAGDISVPEQEKAINEAEVHGYMIRFSQEPGCYTIIVKTSATKAQKLKVVSDAGKPFVIVDKVYSSLYEAIEGTKKQRQLRLKHAIRITKYLAVTMPRRPTRPSLMESQNYAPCAYIDTFQFRDADKPKTEKVKTKSIIDHIDDIFTVSEQSILETAAGKQYICTCLGSRRGSSRESTPNESGSRIGKRAAVLCSRCGLIIKDGALSSKPKEAEIVVARFVLIEAVNTFCEQMVQNRRATFQADITSESPDGPMESHHIAGRSISVGEEGYKHQAEDAAQRPHHQRRHTSTATGDKEAGAVMFAARDSPENIEYEAAAASNSPASPSADELPRNSKRRVLTLQGPVKVLKAATLEKIVEKMTDAVDPLPSEDVVAFLLTHHSIVSPERLIDMLDTRFNSVAATPPIKLAVLSVLKKWLKIQPPYLVELSRKLLVLTKRATNETKNDISDYAKKLRRTLKSRHRSMRQATRKLSIGSRRGQIGQPETQARGPKPGFPSFLVQNRYMIAHIDTKFPKPQMKKIKGDLTLEKLDYLEAARQLTLIEHYLAIRIQYTEFFNDAWEKRAKDTTAPNIVNYISRFNQVTGWVTTEILNRKHAKQRAQIIEFFVDVAKACRHLHSFNIVIQIVFALKSAAVSRLAKTWELVKPSYAHDIGDLTELAHVPSNFVKCRAEQQQASPPRICVLSCCLKDMAAIDAVPDYTENGLINFVKMRRMAAAITAYKQYQYDAYALEPVYPVIEFLLFKLQVIVDSNTLFNLSLANEPRTNK